MNEQLATLLGLLYTDGCVSPKKKNSWRFYFSNKSGRLVEIFRESMMQCFALPSSRVRLGKTKDGLYLAIVNSKEIGTTLTERFGTFRTLRYKDGEFPKACLPIRELLRHNVAKDFLRAAFSCDGGVSLYSAHRKGEESRYLIRGVYLACVHPILRAQYCGLLGALGIKARNVAGDGKIKIQTKEDMELFHQRVGFLEGVHITHTSRFWPNVEKQVLLERLIQSYESPRAIYSLPQFNQKKVMI